jgi:hypothetical protein
VRTAPVAKGVPAGDLAARRAILGWTWAVLMTLSFLSDLRQQHVRCRGVLLYDRHLLVALMQLDFDCGGVNLRLHRVKMRRVLPAAVCVGSDPRFGHRVFSLSAERFESPGTLPATLLSQKDQPLPTPLRSLSCPSIWTCLRR